MPGGLPDGRLHLDQVKPGLTELLQGFVGHLQMALKVNSEPDSEEKQARALRQKITRQSMQVFVYLDLAFNYGNIIIRLWSRKTEASVQQYGVDDVMFNTYGLWTMV